MDLGIYALTWIMVTLHQHPDNKRESPLVVASMLKQRQSGVDEHTTMILDFPEMHAQGIAMCSLTQNSNPTDAHCRIQGDLGEIAVFWAPFRPESYEIRFFDLDPTTGRAVGTSKVERHEVAVPGKGMFYEADECARCLRDGKLESQIIPLADTQLTMEIMDSVREQGNFYYPPELEAVEV